jgi:hypothetical protein
MTNAKEELLEILQKNNLILKCASISYDRYYMDKTIDFSLKVGYSVDEIQKFLDSLDFVYDAGYGSQELYGLVWFTDRTWLEREEYDGSESWSHKKLPEIPSDLL